MVDTCLPTHEHIIDPDGDVVLTLLDPGAAFAEWEPRKDAKLLTPGLSEAQPLPDALNSTGHRGPFRTNGDCASSSISASHLENATEGIGEVKKLNSKARRKLMRQHRFRLTASLSERAVNNKESQQSSPDKCATAAIDGDNPIVQAQPVLPMLDAATRPIFSSHEEGQATNPPSAVLCARFLVSSKKLSLASHIFKIQLTGGWKETTVDASDNRRHLKVTEWNTDAFLVLMNIFHARTTELPKDIGLEMLARIAALVDYYGCLEAVESFATMWIEALDRPAPLRCHRDLTLWLLVSVVFRQEELFTSTTRIMIAQSNKPIASLGLPIPADWIDIMNLRRLDAINCILITFRQLQTALLDESAGCNFECSSALYGALAKNLRNHRLLRKCPKKPFHGHSIAALELAIQDFRSPRWDCPDSHRSGSRNCLLPQMISNRLSKKLWQAKQDLSLSEAPSFKPSSGQCE